MQTSKRLSKMECQKCGKETFLPFKCPYCGGYFCTEHRLPENHECPGLERAHIPTREFMLTSSTSQLKRQSPYEYTMTYYIPVEQEKRFHFSSKEVAHLAVAALLVACIGLSFGLSPRFRTRLGGFTILFVFALTVAASFLAHELAHKFMAQKEGLWAEFRLVFIGLILTVISIVSPIFKIISPGAVVIFGFAKKESVGKISMAGPATNIALSLMLAGLALAIEQPVLMYASAINAWIALFNLIPFGVLDGYKVLTWSKSMWGLAFTASLALTILTYMHLPF
ncbi:MAG: AN1-type zinc finger domain-containing protein [Candidatus Bathyarchaeia archaeon]